MHISDGVLPPSVTVGTAAVALLFAAWSARRTDPDDLPKIAVVSSAFFVASLIHVPIGPTSVHLLIPGVVGILLGRSAFIAVCLGVVLQSLLFQFGGITAIGANACMMGIPALISGWLFRSMRGPSLPRLILAGATAGGLGIVLAVVGLALLLVTGGEDFLGVAKLAMYAHLPVLFIESAIAAFTVSFLFRVKPELLDMSFQAHAAR
ncbi:MAG: cobalt transporter CbiM [Deltaproteobacteria bacterium]|nr:cobalt transporter CbiM [Deltaproteobacteria bacterium]